MTFFLLNDDAAHSTAYSAFAEGVGDANESQMTDDDDGSEEKRQNARAFSHGRRRRSYIVRTTYVYNIHTPGEIYDMFRCGESACEHSVFIRVQAVSLRSIK